MAFSGLSTYARNGLMNLVFGNTAFARAATTYLEPYEAIPNEAGAGGDPPDLGWTARTAVTNNATNYPAASGGVKTLSLTPTLYTASGAENLVGVGIWDALTTGNLLGVFTTALTTDNGKRIKVRPDQLLTLTATTTDFTAAFINSILDHLLGGGDYTPPATWYVGLISTGTTELAVANGYARVGLTNNTTNFPAVTNPDASTSRKSNGVDVVFGPATGSNWTQANRFGLYTASSGGSPVLVKDLDAPVTVNVTETTTFDAGDLKIDLASAV